MSPITLIEARDAFEHVKNNAALLICAYDSDKRFHKLRLEGAIPLSEFQSLSATVDKHKELIFY